MADNSKRMVVLTEGQINTLGEVLSFAVDNGFTENYDPDEKALFAKYKKHVAAIYTALAESKPKSKSKHLLNTVQKLSSPEELDKWFHSLQKGGAA